jgi:hypothetical protein
LLLTLVKVKNPIFFSLVAREDPEEWNVTTAPGVFHSPIVYKWLDAKSNKVLFWIIPPFVNKFVTFIPVLVFSLHSFIINETNSSCEYGQW